MVHSPEHQDANTIRNLLVTLIILLVSFTIGWIIADFTRPFPAGACVRSIFEPKEQGIVVDAEVNIFGRNTGKLVVMLPGTRSIRLNDASLVTYPTKSEAMYYPKELYKIDCKELNLPIVVK